IASFAQLGRDESKPKRFVDGLLRLCREELATSPQPVLVQGEALLCRTSAQRLHVLLRAGGEEKRDAVSSGIGEMHGELPARYDLLRRALQGGRFGHQHQIRNKLTAAPEVARGRDPFQSEPRLAQVCFRRSEQRSGAMQMARAFTPHLQPAKNFDLQPGSQPLHRLEPIMQRGLLQLLYRGDAKLSV